MDAVGSAAVGVTSFWQVAGALLTVLSLLIVALKVLGRYQRQQGSDRTRILQVRRLGPKRELEILQVDDEVYTLYRHDGGLAVLKTEAEAMYRARHAGAAPAAPAVTLGRKLLAMAAAGGSAQRHPSP